MPNTNLPALDKNMVQDWTEQDVNLYHALSFYFAKMQVGIKEFWPTWSKLLGSIPWKPNQGKQMKAVRKNPSPHIRQFAFPSKIFDTAPKKDLIDVREVEVLVDIYRHRFESPVFNFQPSFKDFMKDHVAAHSKDIAEKMIRYEDIYARGRIFHESPFVFLAGASTNSVTNAPWGVGDDTLRALDNAYQASATAKSVAWFQSVLPSVTSNLTFKNLNVLTSIMENDLRVPVFSGSDVGKDDQGLTGKYCLVCSGEAFNQFMFDPWMIANKPIDLDIVHNGWKGSLFGKVTCKIEDLPLRVAADGTFPAPQLREGSSTAYNYDESTNSPIYNAAPFEIAFLVGAQGYDNIPVGPPPAPFSGGSVPEGFGKMFWNGEILMSKNLLLRVDDGTGTGAVVYDTNEYGDYLHLISQATYGILPRQRRNIIPIIFARKRGE